MLVDQLALHGAFFAFCLPGESFLPMLDALRDSSIRLSRAGTRRGRRDGRGLRQVHRRPRICFVTRAPGATHAAVGVTRGARLDADDPPCRRGSPGSPGARRLRSSTTCRLRPDDGVGCLGGRARRGSPRTSRGRSACACRSAGAVVLALPEDVLTRRPTLRTAPRRRFRCGGRSRGSDRLRELLAPADGRSRRRRRRLDGEEGDVSSPSARRTPFRSHIVPLSGLRRRRLGALRRRPHVAMDVHSPAASRCRLIIAVGGRLGDVTTRGYTLLDAPRPRQALVHVHPDPGRAGLVHETELASPPT